jgi:hypothetical protein
MTFDVLNSNRCAANKKARRYRIFKRMNEPGDEEKFAELNPAGQGSSENAVMARVKGLRQKFHRR